MPTTARSCRNTAGCSRRSARPPRPPPAGSIPEAPGRACPRHLEAAGILPAGGGRGGRADRRELPGDGGGRVPHRHGHARRGHHQGQEKGARLARRPRLQLGARPGIRARTEDRDLAGLGAVQREVLARDARLRSGGRGRVPRAVRGGEAHRPRAVRRGVPPAAQAGGMAVAPFREIERSYFDLRWHHDPVGATQAGVKTYDDRYGRFSPSALAPHLAALKSIASALEETTADKREDEIDRTALLNEIRVTLRRFERERPQAKNPGFWLSHLLGGLHFLLGRRDRPSRKCKPPSRTSCWAGATEPPKSARCRWRAGWRTCHGCSTMREPRWSSRCGCSWKRRCASTRAGCRSCGR